VHNPKRALITGISGQDGRYLASLLSRRGIEVLGVDLHPATVEGAVVRAVDITDARAIRTIVEEFAPDECYHFAAYHRSSALRTERADEEEDNYVRVNFVATHRLLQALRSARPSCRFFLAGSCHMFGAVETMPQTEATPYLPNSAYGITKLAAWNFAKMYRDRGDLFCSLGILFNHESPLRALDFVTARIARGVAEIVHKKRDHLVIGNLAAQVDWGFVGDYVDAMRRILQHDEPDEFIIASGSLHTVGEFVAAAFEHVGLDWRAYVREDPGVHKPVQPGTYHGDISKIRTKLGWEPTTPFASLVAMMVDHHLVQTERD
jgi:GDPmannose 4,6-dehydratase